MSNVYIYIYKYTREVLSRNILVGVRFFVIYLPCVFTFRSLGRAFVKPACNMDDTSVGKDFVLKYIVPRNFISYQLENIAEYHLTCNPVRPTSGDYLMQFLSQNGDDTVCLQETGLVRCALRSCRKLFRRYVCLSRGNIRT